VTFENVGIKGFITSLIEALKAEKPSITPPFLEAHLPYLTIGRYVWG